MADINSIALGLQSLKTAIDITKELRNVDSTLKDAEFKLKLAELIEALAEAKIQISEANETILDLKSQVKELNTRLNLDKEVVFRDGNYYLKNPMEGEAPGPFCSTCYGSEKKLIVLSELPRSMRTTIGTYRCSICKNVSK